MWLESLGAICTLSQCLLGHMLISDSSQCSILLPAWLITVPSEASIVLGAASVWPNPLWSQLLCSLYVVTTEIMWSPDARRKPKAHHLRLLCQTSQDQAPTSYNWPSITGSKLLINQKAERCMSGSRPLASNSYASRKTLIWSNIRYKNQDYYARLNEKKRLMKASLLDSGQFWQYSWLDRLHIYSRQTLLCHLSIVPVLLRQLLNPPYHTSVTAFSFPGSDYRGFWMFEGQRLLVYR